MAPVAVASKEVGETYRWSYKNEPVVVEEIILTGGWRQAISTGTAAGVAALREMRSNSRRNTVMYRIVESDGGTSVVEENALKKDQLSPMQD